MGLSTHILDTAQGRPAANVALVLAQLCDGEWRTVGAAQTDDDGRCQTLLGEAVLAPSTYRLHFETAPYFAALGQTSLYPCIEICFTVADPVQHYHIPLLLAANGYTTYRGS